MKTNGTNKLPISKETKTQKSEPKQDGELISMVKINVEENSDLQAYRMTYWSATFKVVAYVALPKVGGIYPMQLNLHGGYALPYTVIKHVSTLMSEGSIITLNSSLIKDSPSRAITLAPMYRGYDKSEGFAQGLSGAALDSNNAVKALLTYLNSNKDGPQFEKGHIYLYGVSLGGGVALKLASERQDIINVAAISPFAGWDLEGAWYKKHDKNIFNKLQKEYGPFDPNSPVYKKQSIDFTKIKVPVLLVQGTDDPNVPWQAVQEFYKEIETDNKNVTIKLIKGGNHGLTNKEELLKQTLTNFGRGNWEG